MISYHSYYRRECEMPYIDPATVITPKTKVRDVRVVFDRGEQDYEGWSVAELTWDEEHTIGIRWNGDPRGKRKGTPVAHGYPTWFIVPRELQDVVLERARELAEGGRAALKAGYTEMARDQEREREAEEWSEGLIGDPARDQR
jgi:hypothetical protein